MSQPSEDRDEEELLPNGQPRADRAGHRAGADEPVCARRSSRCCRAAARSAAWPGSRARSSRTSAPGPATANTRCARTATSSTSSINHIFTDTFRSEGWAPIFHVLGGTDIQVMRHLLLSFEARYSWQHADLDSDFIDFEPIDLGGLPFRRGHSFRVLGIAYEEDHFPFALILYRRQRVRAASPPHSPRRRRRSMPASRRWLGCWRLDDDLAGTGARMCITPEKGGVRLQTVVGTNKGIDELVIADGVSRPIADAECKGTEQAEWSEDGARVFRTTNVTCGKEAPRTIKTVAVHGAGPGVDQRAARERRLRERERARAAVSPRRQPEAGRRQHGAAARQRRSRCARQPETRGASRT